MPETSESSLQDSVPTAPAESVLLSNEASLEEQNLPSPLGDTATPIEPQKEKKKHQEYASDTFTDTEQLQENLLLPQSGTAQAPTSKKEVCEIKLRGRERCSPQSTRGMLS